jgi:hypothetical protein
MKRLVFALFTLCLAGSVLSAGEKKLMHCFTFTPIESATPADWDAFYKATTELPGKVPGLSHVWSGKLRSPQKLLMGADRESYQKVQAASNGEQLTVPAKVAVRSYGACMEFDNEAALKAYADNPAHAAWLKVYGKVRQPGTTTFDILGE